MFINRDAPSLGRDENLVHDSVVCGTCTGTARACQGGGQMIRDLDIW